MSRGLDDAVERRAIDQRSLTTGKARARHGSRVSESPSSKNASGLADGGVTARAVRDAVDEKTRTTADASRQIVLERDRLSPRGRQVLVQDVEHLEERHGRGHAVDLVGTNRPGVFRSFCRQILRRASCYL